MHTRVALGVFRGRQGTPRARIERGGRREKKGLPPGRNARARLTRGSAACFSFSLRAPRSALVKTVQSPLGDRLYNRRAAAAARTRARRGALLTNPHPEEKKTTRLWRARRPRPLPTRGRRRQACERSRLGSSAVEPSRARCRRRRRGVRVCACVCCWWWWGGEAPSPRTRCWVRGVSRLCVCVCVCVVSRRRLPRMHACMHTGRRERERKKEGREKKDAPALVGVGVLAAELVERVLKRGLGVDLLVRDRGRDLLDLLFGGDGGFGFGGRRFFFVAACERACVPLSLSRAQKRSRMQRVAVRGAWVLGCVCCPRARMHPHAARRALAAASRRPANIATTTTTTRAQKPHSRCPTRRRTRRCCRRRTPARPP